MTKTSFVQAVIILLQGKLHIPIPIIKWSIPQRRKKKLQFKHILISGKSKMFHLFDYKLIYICIYRVKLYIYIHRNIYIIICSPYFQGFYTTHNPYISHFGMLSLPRPSWPARSPTPSQRGVAPCAARCGRWKERKDGDMAELPWRLQVGDGWYGYMGWQYIYIFIIIYII
jgi:hypothetical protein